MPKAAKRLRLIAYMRVSKLGERDPDAANFQAIPQQRSAIEHAVALRPGAEVVEWIEDLNESGGTMNRPGLQRALELVAASRADGIVVAKLDRWARTGQGIDAIEQLEDNGKVFISAADHFDTSTSTGRFALGLMVLVAKLIRDQHIETWADTTRNAITRGVHTTVPYGYRRSNGKGSPLAPYEPEAKVVRRIFADRMRGWGVAAIADALNADGIPAPRSPAWTRQTVRRLIRTSVYKGEARYGEHVHEHAHEPLVDEDTWTQAQPGRLERREPKTPTLLLGLVRCAGCGYVMGVGSSKGGRRYNCGRNHATGKCPSPTTAPAERLEQLVLEAFMDRYGTVEARGASDEDPRVASTKTEVERLQREYVAWRDDTGMRDALGDADYRAGLLARKEALDAAVEDHEHAVRESTATNLAIDATVWADLDLREQRLLLKAGIDTVKLSRAASTHSPLPDRVEIFWTGEAPDDLPRPSRSRARPDRNP